MAITSEEINDLAKGILGAVSFDYENIIGKSVTVLDAQLALTNITDKERGGLLTTFTSQTVSQAISTAIMAAADLAKTNAEIVLRANEPAKALEEINILKEQVKQEQYKYSNLLPEEYAGLQQDVLLKAQQVVTETKKQAAIDSDKAKIDAEKLLVDQQTAGEVKKNAANGLIDQQTSLYEEQAKSFKGHNISKAADSISQMISMIVAEGATPSTALTSAHSALIVALAALSSTTLTPYTTVK